MGTSYAVDRMREMYTWNLTGRRGNMPSAAGHIEVTEFDYRKNHVIYELNGVKIRPWPAVHTIDGAVSYSLEWQGKKFVYSGDTVPKKWFLAEVADADLLIHECYFTVQQLVDLKKYDPERARIVPTVLHTPPSSCGKIFSRLQPRMTIAYPNFAYFNVAPGTLEEIRRTCNGPLTSRTTCWSGTSTQKVFVYEGSSARMRHGQPRLLIQMDRLIAAREQRNRTGSTTAVLTC